MHGEDAAAVVFAIHRTNKVVLQARRETSTDVPVTSKPPFGPNPPYYALTVLGAGGSFHGSSVETACVMEPACLTLVKRYGRCAAWPGCRTAKPKKKQTWQKPAVGTAAVWHRYRLRHLPRHRAPSYVSILPLKAGDGKTALLYPVAAMAAGVRRYTGRRAAPRKQISLTATGDLAGASAVKTHRCCRVAVGLPKERPSFGTVTD
ncbi:hypothetical protein FQR65_LT20210 [Abscondita terminalis]|nr:hypothetical protein FQR65_LT20210 [Abscondita terminalis]